MKFKSKIYDLLYIYLKTMESNKLGSCLTFFLNLFSIFVYFTQMLSYLFKMNIPYISDDSFKYIEKMFFYFNFSNLVLYLDNFYIYMITYFMSLVGIAVLISYIFIIYLVNKYFLIKTSKIITFCNLIYCNYYELYVWIFMLPSIDILLFPLSCDNLDNSVVFCNRNMNYLLFVSIISIILIVCIGLLYVVMCRSYEFMDLKNFKLNFNVNQVLCLFLRISLASFYPFMNSSKEYIYHLILHGIGIISIFDYIYCFPIRNQKLNKFYISILLSFEAILIGLSSWKYFNLLGNGSLFFVITVLVLLCIKKGVSVSIYRNFSILLGYFNEKRTMDYNLEELIILFNSHKISLNSHFMMLGILKNHAKNCKNKKCKFTIKKMCKFEIMGVEEQEIYINSFIFQTFVELIDKQKKENYCEQLIIKFMSYLTHSNLSPEKAFFEVQKLPSIFKNFSFYGRLIYVLLNKKLQIKIEEIDRERQLTRTKLDQNGNLEIKEFFKITKQKDTLESGMKHLLKAKIALWEKYQNGFQSYEEAIKVLNAFSLKAITYKRKLEGYFKNARDNVIIYKFSSIYHCVIVNRIIDATKEEDEIENIKKRYIRADNDEITPIIFYQDNFTTCEASFLNTQGEILESSKNVKFANFFNYNVEETKLMKNIESLMPEMISKNHHRFVRWSLNRPRKDLLTRSSKFMSYALDKNQCIFPIKIFLSHSFNYENDFIMHAAMIKLDLKGVPCLIFDSKGQILGVTKELLGKFKEEIKEITVEGILQLNVYNLLPKLKEHIKTNKIFEEDTFLEYRNLTGKWWLFQNMLEVIELIKHRKSQLELLSLYKKEAQSQSNNNSRTIISSKSVISSASRLTRNMKDIMNDANNKISNYLNKWQQNSNNSSFNTNINSLQKIFLDDAFSNEDIINMLTEKSPQNKRRVIYDLSIHQSKFGNKKDDVIKYGTLALKYISEDLLLEEDKSQIINDGVPESKISNSVQQSLKMPGENIVEFKVEFERVAYSKSELDKSPNLSQCIEENFEKKITEVESKNVAFQRIEIKKSISLQKNEEDFKKMLEAPTMAMENQMTKIFTEELKKDKLSFDSSSRSKEKERIKLEGLKGKTTDLGPLQNKDNNSLNASSRGTSKKSYAIINMVEVIQFKYPKSIRNIGLLFLFQLIFIFVYCISLFVLSRDYINNYYLPLQAAAIDQSKTNSDFAFYVAFFNEYEYYYRGIKPMTDFQLYAFNKLLAIVEVEAFQLLDSEIQKPDQFQYQPYLKQLTVTYVDFETYIPETILFNDMSDLFLLLGQWNYDRELQVPLTVLQCMARNMVYYLPAAANVRTQIQDEFLSSNNIIGTQIVTIFAVLMSIIAFEKLIEYAVYVKYMDKITKLVNIFLRISQRESTNEFYLSKQILDFLNDSNKSYQNEYFPDICVNKKNFNELLEGDNNLNKLNKEKKNAKKGKKKHDSGKKFSLYNLRTLSKMKMLGFLIISVSLMFGYLISNYIFWTSTNTSISQLISINNMFNNLYIYSTTVMVYNNLMIREIAERDPLWEASGDSMQNHVNRLNYFYTTKISRLNSLKQFTMDLPNYAIPAQSVINDPNYDQLLYGSACEALYSTQQLDLEMYTFCQTNFSGAFTKGILNFMDEYIQELTNQNDITFIPTTQAEIDAQLVQLEIYYNDITTGTLPISVYVITRGLILFYEYISTYYENVLNQQLSNMNIMLWTTCSLCIVIMSVFCYLMLRYLRTIYFRTAFILGLIPHDKLVNDEQTIYLIKQYWKENN